MRGQRVGALIGAVGGLAFVVVNAGQLPGAAEVVAIPVGAQVLVRLLHQPQLVVLWVVAVVGAHFVPFARAFHAPVFTPLAWTLIGIAAVGAAVALAVGAKATGTATDTATDTAATTTAATAAVLAGATLLAFSASSAFGRRWGRPAAERADPPHVST